MSSWLWNLKVSELLQLASRACLLAMASTLVVNAVKDQFTCNGECFYSPRELWQFRILLSLASDFWM